MGAALGFVWVAAALAALPPRAAAHDQPFAFATLHLARTRLTVDLAVHRDDAAQALGIGDPESLMDRAFLDGVAPRLGVSLASAFRIRAGGRDLPLRLEGWRPAPREHAVHATFTATMPRSPGTLEIQSSLFASTPDYETFLAVYDGPRLVRQDVLTARHARAQVVRGGLQGTLAVIATFVRAGIHHIFIGPDHILFLVGLLLLGGGVPRILKIATAFTIAHSITLAAAALAWVTLPSRLVEPLIALSIVVVGVENLRHRPGTRDARIRLAFFFGLIHGFGFASVLREVGLPREALGWSLFAFNVGVEAGQACIVLATAPVLAGIRRWRPAVATRTVALASWGVVLAGGVWFVQRTWGV